MELPLSKNKQLKHRKRKKSIPKVTIKEDAIQKQCNDMLDWNGIKYIRIEDYVWSGLKTIIRELSLSIKHGLSAKKTAWLLHLSQAILSALSDRFAGMDDIVAFIPVMDKYSLCLSLELKTEAGKQSTKQKRWNKQVSGRESRSPDQTIVIINEFIRDAEIIKKLIIKSQEDNNAVG